MIADFYIKEQRCFVKYNLNGRNGFLVFRLHFAPKRRQLFLLVPARRTWLVCFPLAPGSCLIMPISARLMFVPGGFCARRLDHGRFSASSQRISYGSPSRRLPLCRCRDTV